MPYLPKQNDLTINKFFLFVSINNPEFFDPNHLLWPIYKYYRLCTQKRSAYGQNYSQLFTLFAISFIYRIHILGIQCANTTNLNQLMVTE